jgi:Putative peptidoglycan binding domain
LTFEGDAIKTHTVQQGECTASIAFENGFFADTLWNAPENKDLRDLRKDLHVLLPGDVVQIPDLRPKVETCATDQVYRFRRKGVPDVLKLQFLENGDPRVGIPWELKIDGVSFKGKTDDKGFVSQSLLPDAKEAVLTLSPGDDKPDEQYTIQLRHLDPVAQISGQQARLKNLGFFDHPVDGQSSPDFEQAVRSFQAANKIEPTGKVDDDTAKALQSAHGC